MDHKTKMFIFLINREKIEFKTKPYTFKIDEYLHERFDEKELKKFYAGGIGDLGDIRLEDVQKDMPYFLEDNKNQKVSSIKWEEQEDYNHILEVYFFFLNYKRNAYLKQIELDKATLALALTETLQQMNSIQGIFSKPV